MNYPLTVAIIIGFQYRNYDKYSNICNTKLDTTNINKRSNSKHDIYGNSESSKLSGESISLHYTLQNINNNIDNTVRGHTELYGITIDLFQAYNFVKKLNPHKITVITDIEDDEKWYRLVNAMKLNIVNSDVGNFIDDIKKHKIYHRYTNPDDLCNLLKQCSHEAKRVFFYYTGHGRPNGPTKDGGAIYLPAPIKLEKKSVNKVEYKNGVNLKFHDDNLSTKSNDLSMVPIYNINGEINNFDNISDEKSKYGSNNIADGKYDKIHRNVTMVDFSDLDKIISNVKSNVKSNIKYPVSDFISRQIHNVNSSGESTWDFNDNKSINKMKAIISYDIPKTTRVDSNKGGLNYNIIITARDIRKILFESADNSAEFIFIYDCCYGVDMDFPFELDDKGLLHLTNNIPQDFLTNWSVSILNKKLSIINEIKERKFFKRDAICISSGSHLQSSISSSDGSYFTRYLFEMLNNRERSLSKIKQHIENHINNSNDNSISKRSQIAMIHCTYPDLIYIWPWVFNYEHEYRITVDENDSVIKLETLCPHK